MFIDMDDKEAYSIQQSLLEFFDPYDWPTLCTDRTEEGLEARDLLHKCSIPFHYWNAETHPPNMITPFMIYRKRTAFGLDEIENLARDYIDMLREHRLSRKTEDKIKTLQSAHKALDFSANCD